MLTLVIFLLILSVLILIHEIGHFIAAKKMGVAVEEFGVGIPPRMYGKKIGDTIYSINWLPFGGFVRLRGEDDEVGVVGKILDKQNFMAKKPWQRALILTAGVIMNTFLAVFMYYVLFFSNNFTSLAIPLLFDYEFKFGEEERIGTVITAFQENSLAANTNIEPGEAILAIDDISVNSISEIHEALEGKLHKDVVLTLTDVRKASKGTRLVTVETIADDNGEAILGVYLTQATNIHYDKPLTKAFSGFLHCINMLSYSGHTFGKLIEISILSKDIRPVSESVSGPVGIFSIVGIILDYSGKEAFLNMIDFLALLSLSLAFINILPLPALDGGRLLFVLIEVIKGERLNPKVEAELHKWGTLVFIALIIIVTFRDVQNLFSR